MINSLIKDDPPTCMPSVDYYHTDSLCGFISGHLYKQFRMYRYYKLNNTELTLLFIYYVPHN